MFIHSMRRGFTLIEIAIVLVTIALIAGGIMVGDNMITNAKLVSLITEKQKFETAAMQFKDKYKALPGDMYNATSFWGAWTTCPRGSATTATTCNGNGNGKIALSKTKSDTTASGDMYEAHRVWQHLGLSGFIDGSFNGGMETSGTIVTTPGVRVPKANYNETSGWHLYYLGPQSGSSDFFDGEYRHILYMGSGAYDATVAVKNSLMPAEIASMDKKSDDGLASTGNIRSGKNASTTFGGSCISASTLTYDTSATSATCVPIFITNIQ